jgi:uncharacterized protein
MLKTGLIIAILLVPSLVLGASFDCRKAGSEVEKLICADQSLSQLDETLSKIYRKAMRSASDPESLKLEQTKWLREERDRCADKSCLEKVYHNRLAALEELLPVRPAGEESGAPS